MTAEADRKRLLSLLAEIGFSPGVGLAALRQALEFTHNIPASGARVRADLLLLADMGLIRWDGEGALCTARGLDVARGRAELPEA